MLLVLLAALSLLCASPGCNKVDTRAPLAQDGEHIRQVIRGLPTDSQMRSDLARGDRGKGVRYTWMDHMKRLNVQRATVYLDFAYQDFFWRGRPVDVNVRRIAFFRKYDPNCSRISDAKQLEMIENTGLARELKEFAIAQTASSDWSYFEDRPQANRGTATVQVVDDEWLPVLPPNLVPLGDDHRRPRIVVDGDVERLQETLRSTRFSTGELDVALLHSAMSLDDACFINPLIEAGADPNARNANGETPLMLAAESGHSHSLEALLKAGADPRSKNTTGETALVLAQVRERWHVVSMLRQIERGGSLP